MDIHFYCFTEDFLSTYLCSFACICGIFCQTEPSVRRDRFSMTGVSSTTPDCYTSVPGPSGIQPVVGVHEAAARAVAGAGGRSSTNGSSDTPVRPKKRPRRPDRWKKNVAKLKRVRGEEYISPSSGRVVPPRKTGEACKCKRRRCFEYFSDHEKKDILSQFNHLANKEIQDAYLFGLISSSALKH